MADESTKLPAGRGPSRELQPFESLRQELNRTFDDFGRGIFRSPFRGSMFEPVMFGESGSMPAADVAEHDTEYEITMELPGTESGDVDVKFANGVLTITGEKKHQEEEEKKNYYMSERRFGSFRRSFEVPDSVDTSAIEAAFNNGVLTVHLPKSAKAQEQERKIQIKSD